LTKGIDRLSCVMPSLGFSVNCRSELPKNGTQEKLRELVVGINRLLDAIEAALAKIEEYSEPSDA